MFKRYKHEILEFGFGNQKKGSGETITNLTSQAFAAALARC